jgi:hypothetical protein
MKKRAAWFEEVLAERQDFICYLHSALRWTTKACDIVKNANFPVNIERSGWLPLLESKQPRQQKGSVSKRFPA